MNIADYKGFVFDLDGVIWRGNQVIPGAPEAVALLRKNGRKVTFVTNYAGQTREQQLEKLNRMGIAASVQEVITSGFACALYLKKEHPGRKVHVLGPDSLRTELTEHGIEVVETGAGAVVVARDGSFNFEKLDAAFQNMLSADCLFVVCAANAIHPGENGRLHPGGGVMVAALQACSGRAPDVVIGKPNTPMMELALKVMDMPARGAVMVGDILDMDIRAGGSAGMESIYVLSGVGKREDIERFGIVPTHVLDSVASIEQHFR